MKIRQFFNTNDRMLFFVLYNLAFKEQPRVEDSNHLSRNCEAICKTIS